MAARIGELLLTLLLIAILATTGAQNKTVESSCNMARKQALKEKYELKNLYSLPQAGKTLSV